MSDSRTGTVLRFSYGIMGSGKSTVALQVHHNLTRRGLHGILCTLYDRDGTKVSSRLGVSRQAIEVTPGLDLLALLHRGWLVEVSVVVGQPVVALDDEIVTSDLVVGDVCHGAAPHGHDGGAARSHDVGRPRVRAMVQADGALVAHHGEGRPARIGRHAG